MKSCLTFVVILVLAGVVYNVYRDSQEPVTPKLEGELSPEYRKTIVSSFEDFLDQNSNIDRLSLDGSTLDIHYKNKESKNIYRLDATFVAESFSNRKYQLLGNSNVLVRCIHDDLIQLEATAQTGRVVEIKEL